MAEEDSGGSRVASSLIWALALIIVVSILGGVIFYSGVLSRTNKHEIDINVKPPAAAK